MFSSYATGKVTYFGVWAEEADERRLLAHALEILRNAVADCSEQDVCTDELGQALAFVESSISCGRRWCGGSARRSMCLIRWNERAAATRQAYEAIVRAV